MLYIECIADIEQERVLLTEEVKQKLSVLKKAGKRSEVCYAIYNMIVFISEFHVSHPFQEKGSDGTQYIVKLMHLKLCSYTQTDMTSQIMLCK